MSNKVLFWLVARLPLHVGALCLWAWSFQILGILDLSIGRAVGGLAVLAVATTLADMAWSPMPPMKRRCDYDEREVS